jgi:betaine-homocysteine S-methyltransferase
MTNNFNNNFLTFLKHNPLICAEGYIFELERRGYISAGSFVPEVVLSYPDALIQVTRDFIRAGSDCVLACTYYAHREKLKNLGKENILRELNIQALTIAHTVANEFRGENIRPLFVGGNICNTNIFDSEDSKSKDTARSIFAEVLTYVKEIGADFVLGETFAWYGEALIALQEIKKLGIPSVINLTIPANGKTLEGINIDEACYRLQQEGADVIGLNCAAGPQTILPFIAKVRKRLPDAILSAIPVTYRTNDKHPNFLNLPDEKALFNCPDHPNNAFPTALEPLLSNRYEVAEFGRSAFHDYGVNFLGLCCGNTPAFTRALAHSIGIKTRLSKYDPDLSMHSLYGKNNEINNPAQRFIKEGLAQIKHI